MEWPYAQDDKTLGVVDFSIFPHLNVFPGNTLAAADRWAAEIANPSYVIDDETAITVVDGAVEVVSEGLWKHFPAVGAFYLGAAVLSKVILLDIRQDVRPQDCESILQVSPYFVNVYVSNPSRTTVAVFMTTVNAPDITAYALEPSTVQKPIS